MEQMAKELEGSVLVNNYGPTETTVWSTCARILPRGELAPDVHIGRPIANTRAYVLDAVVGAGATRPEDKAATPTAPAPSTYSLARSIRSTMASAMASSSTKRSDRGTREREARRAGRRAAVRAPHRDFPR